MVICLTSNYICIKLKKSLNFLLFYFQYVFMSFFYKWVFLFSFCIKDNVVNFFFLLKQLLKEKVFIWKVLNMTDLVIIHN